MRPNKRDELVRKALDILYCNGFHATGMDKLVAETGISKTSMYKHFRTKEELILAALRLRDEQFRNWLYRRLEEGGATPREQLLTLFDAMHEWFTQAGFRGCMFIKASSEYQEADHPIHMHAAQHKRLLLDHIRGMVEKTGVRDASALARQIMLLAEGAIVAAHLSLAPEPAMDARAAAETLLDAAAKA